MVYWILFTRLGRKLSLYWLIRKSISSTPIGHKNNYPLNKLPPGTESSRVGIIILLTFLAGPGNFSHIAGSITLFYLIATHSLKLGDKLAAFFSCRRSWEALLAVFLWLLRSAMHGCSPERIEFHGLIDACRLQSCKSHLLGCWNSLFRVLEPPYCLDRTGFPLSSKLAL